MGFLPVSAAFSYGQRSKLRRPTEQFPAKEKGYQLSADSLLSVYVFSVYVFSFCLPSKLDRLPGSATLNTGKEADTDGRVRSQSRDILRHHIAAPQAVLGAGAITKDFCISIIIVTFCRLYGIDHLKQ